LIDVRDDQAEDGRYPDFAPFPPDPIDAFGAPGWADAGLVVPWCVYLNYADRRVLEEHFSSARRWVEFVLQRNPDRLWKNARGRDYNDWLNGDTLIHESWPRTGGMVPKSVLATACFAHSAHLLSKMAAALGYTETASEYETLFDEIRVAFNRAYVDEQGRIEGETQAGYALALSFDLLPDGLRSKAAAHLLESLECYDGHLSTGFQTTHRLLLELTRNGYNDEAYRLLNLQTFPSWGFMIENGATTIWERWDGYVKGRGFQEPTMNSFNHWALGAVAEWMWRNIIGIQPDESHPGYKHFVIHPRSGGGLEWAKGEYHSIRGRIATAWKIDSTTLTLQVEIPANTQATVHVPTADLDSVRESDALPQDQEGIDFVCLRDEAAIYRLDSGRYTFTAFRPNPSGVPFEP
jgi:alpha-L-rhamnosidase